MSQPYQPLVSVLVNCFNGEKYLAQAIESILSQTYKNFEIIFWDNQSTDRSAEIFKSYSDPRMKYYYAPRHTKLYEARGEAFRHVNGQLLAFLDVDDLWDNRKLELQVQYFQEDSEVGMCCGNFLVQNLTKDKSWYHFNEEKPSGYVLEELLRDFYVGLLTLMVRVDAIKSLQPIFDPRFHIIGDYDLVFKLAPSWKLATIQEVLATYRIHGANETSKRMRLQVDELNLWISNVEKDPKFCKSKNFKYAKGRIAYITGISDLLDGDRLGAAKMLSKVNDFKMRVRLFLGLISPRFIIKKIKN